MSRAQQASSREPEWALRFGNAATELLENPINSSTISSRESSPDDGSPYEYRYLLPFRPIPTYACGLLIDRKCRRLWAQDLFKEDLEGLSPEHYEFRIWLSDVGLCYDIPEIIHNEFPTLPVLQNRLMVVREAPVHPALFYPLNLLFVLADNATEDGRTVPLPDRKTFKALVKRLGCGMQEPAWHTVTKMCER